MKKLIYILAILLFSTQAYAQSQVASQPIPVTSGTTYTYSLWIKGYVPAQQARLLWNAGSGQASQDITLVTDWKRYSFTFTADGTELYVYFISDTTVSGNRAYVWGAKVEEGLYPTSYTRTEATAVTRTADDVTFDLHPAGKHPVLPVTINGPFTVEFEAKCAYEDNTEISASKTLLSISGNEGDADIDTNNFEIYIDSNGKVNASLYDSASTQHTLQSAADPTPFNAWFKVKAYMDLSDQTQNDMWINGSNASITKVGNTGTATWSTLSNKIRMGQNYAGTVSSDCSLRNIRISPKQF